MDKRDFIINELMAENFIEAVGQQVLLEEDEETGKSELQVHLEANQSLCIKNVDKKKTEIQFFRRESRLSMFKRVDHIIFEPIKEDKWRVHLIEMKSSVNLDKWIEIKGKFRASYLVVQAIAAMLDMELAEICFYTTFENANFINSETAPAGRRVRTGMKLIRPEEEWNGGKFGLNYGERLPFRHVPVPMTRDLNRGLVGVYIC